MVTTRQIMDSLQEMFKKNKRESKYDLLVLETCLVKSDQSD